MRKKIILAAVIVFTIVSSVMGTRAYLCAKDKENLRSAICASRERYALDESIEEADVVAEVTMGVRRRFIEPVWLRHIKENCRRKLMFCKMEQKRCL